MTATFRPVKRPEPVLPDTTLDAELGKAADDAHLTLYFLDLAVVRASGLGDKDIGSKSDPYCVVTVGDISDRTEVVPGNLNPAWNKKMHFFVARKPDSVVFRVLDDDSNNVGLGERDDALGEATMEIGDLFETSGAYEGELPLEKGQGSIFVHLKCRVMKPIETEVKLNFAEMQIAGKEKEREATVHALDESEQLREDAISQLSAAEQEVSILIKSMPSSAFTIHHLTSSLLRWLKKQRNWRRNRGSIRRSSLPKNRIF